MYLFQTESVAQTIHLHFIHNTGERRGDLSNPPPPPPPPKKKKKKKKKIIIIILKIKIYTGQKYNCFSFKIWIQFHFIFFSWYTMTMIGINALTMSPFHFINFSWCTMTMIVIVYHKKLIKLNVIHILMEKQFSQIFLGCIILFIYLFIYFSFG